MRSKMPQAVKIAVSVVCAALLLNVICEWVQELSFIKSFLKYAVGLDHKAIILAAPVVNVASTLLGGAILIALIVALALGKSWARKTYIVMVALQLVGIGCMAVASEMSPCFAQNSQHSHWWDWINIVCDVIAIVMLCRRDVTVWYREDATAENRWKNRLQCLIFWVLLLFVGGACGMVQGVAENMSNPRRIADKFPRLRVAELKARADHGDAPSMWRLGNWERNGWLGEKHPDKAVEWYRKAADRGDKFALNALGDCYEKGIGTATNLTEAVTCWMKAAERKHSWAACKVAIRHQKDKKQKEAFEWFRKSADLGSDYGCCKLGECYEKGWGTETNAALAAEWFLKGAERRHNWGMEKMGDFYRDGFGVEKDLAEAREWYEKAIKRGNKNAQKKLDALPEES